MKRAIAITGIVLITLLYCFATCSIVNASIAHDILDQNIDGGEKRNYFSSDYTPSFYYSPKNEVSLNAFQYSLNLNLKNQFSGFSFFIKSKEIKIKTEFIQYVYEIQNALIRYRKTDIVFPFHNFW